MENSEDKWDILSKLDRELNDSWNELKRIREAYQQGELGLERYTREKKEIETRINELSQRIQYICKARDQLPTTEERIIKEAELLMNEFQVELINESIYHIRIYLTVSVRHTWVIEVNFSDPKVPLFKIPTELPLVIGDPYKELKTLKNWRGASNQHLVSIIRELEQKILNQELAKSLPELELERGRVMSQAKELEEDGEYSRAMVFYNYAADISERIGNEAIAIMCRLKAKKMLSMVREKKSR
ncbi:MAG: hypothetical protein HWN65_19445 [Candidatus Helarchaeota archaeon]|nr:hypothetical protein [Candidatus Helarchaeota archaeon]